MKSKPLNVGIIGLGTVGGGTAEILSDRSAVVKRAAGRPVILSKACDLSAAARRRAGLARGIATASIEKVIDNPEIDIVVELIGGIQPARRFIEKALDNGKHVVTANKALLACCGPALFSRAAERGLCLGYEASVCGAVPILGAMRGGLCVNRIRSILGIVNGTTNFILTRMNRTGDDYEKSLAEAVTRGIAETDPSLDVSGKDAGHKLGVMSMLAWHEFLDLSKVPVKGITRLKAVDIEAARPLGYVIKLLAVGKKDRFGRIDARVGPAMLPTTHPLAAVDDTNNAVYVDGDLTGPTMYYGHGAGREPTASSVVSDIVAIASGAMLPPAVPKGRLKPARPSDVSMRVYIRAMAQDRPGVLARMASALGKAGISIASCMQPEKETGAVVPIILLTHNTDAARLNRAVREINRLSMIKGSIVVIPIEE